MNEEYLKDIESEISLIGEIIELQNKQNLSMLSVEKQENQLQTKLTLLKIYESYLADIDSEMNSIAFYMEMKNEIERLKSLLEASMSEENKWKKQYDDLAKSKLGRIQRFWWRITKREKRRLKWISKRD